MLRIFTLLLFMTLLIFQNFWLRAGRRREAQLRQTCLELGSALTDCNESRVREFVAGVGSGAVSTWAIEHPQSSLSYAVISAHAQEILLASLSIRQRDFPNLPPLTMDRGRLPDTNNFWQWLTKKVGRP